MVYILGYVNLIIASFNLLPIEGYDGEIAWRVIPLLREQLRARRATQAAIRRMRKKG